MEEFAKSTFRISGGVKSALKMYLGLGLGACWAQVGSVQGSEGERERETVTRMKAGLEMQ